MKFAFVSDKEYYVSWRDGDKLARVYDLCRAQHPDAELEWITRLGKIDVFQPDKIFVDPRLRGRVIPDEILNYPCEKDFTLENWLKDE